MKNRHPLGKLIDTIRESNRWSYRDLARRAERAGFKMGDSQINALANNPISSVSIKQVRALAVALDIPERHVVVAFLGSMGYDVAGPSPSGVEEAIRADGRLSSDDRETLLVLLKQMRRRTTDRRDNEPVNVQQQQPMGGKPFTQVNQVTTHRGERQHDRDAEVDIPMERRDIQSLD